MSKNKREFWESSKMNNATYVQYYNRLTELSLSMFDWQNVPDTVDVRFLELALFTDGKAVFFYDEDMGDGEYLGLRVATGGELNVYRVPKTRRAYASNGYNKELTDKNSVIIYNNYLRTNSMLDVEMFSKRLYNLDRAIDVNANAQKTPVVILCDEDQRLTMKNLYMKYEGNEPFIFGDNNLRQKGNEITSINTGAPYVADKLYQLKTQLWNEALTYLGISNVSIVKKERMVSDEVLRNQGGVLASRYSRLNARQEACKAINKMFGLNMWCEYKEDLRIETTEDLTEPKKEGEEE